MTELAPKENPSTPAGELRLHLTSPQDPRVDQLQGRLGYAYSYQRPKVPAESYEATLATTVAISSPEEFHAEYQRVVQILAQARLAPGWDMELAYYPAGERRFTFYAQFDSNQPKKPPL